MTDTTIAQARLAQATAAIQECDRQLGAARAFDRSAAEDLGRATAAGLYEGTSDAAEIKRLRRVRTDAAAVWATGEFWWQIPRTVQVVLEGKLPDGSSGKDIIIALCGLYGDEVLNAAGELLCEGSTVLGCLDMATKRPRELPEELTALVGETK